MYHYSHKSHHLPKPRIGVAERATPPLDADMGLYCLSFPVQRDGDKPRLATDTLTVVVVCNDGQRWGMHEVGDPDVFAEAFIEANYDDTGLPVVTDDGEVLPAPAEALARLRSERDVTRPCSPEEIAEPLTKLIEEYGL